MLPFILLTLGLPCLATALVCGQVYPASHLNPETRCNFQGSLQAPSQLGRTIILTRPRSDRAQTTCRNYCLDNQYCLSYSYNVESGDCNLYNKKVVDMGVQAGRTGTFLWNRYCWAQNYTTSLGLQNSGFEDVGTNGRQLRPWNRASSDRNILPIQSSPGSNGTDHSALLRVGKRIGVFNMSISQTFSACPNTTYYIQPMYKYLGAKNSSRSYLSTAFSTSSGGTDGACAAASASSIRPGQAKTDWSVLIPYYDNGDSFDTFYVLRSGKDGIGTFAMSISAAWKHADRNIGDPPTPDPVLDQYLIDLNVQTAPTPEKDTYDGISCYIGGRGNAGAGAGAGSGPP